MAEQPYLRSSTGMPIFYFGLDQDGNSHFFYLVERKKCAWVLLLKAGYRPKGGGEEYISYQHSTEHGLGQVYNARKVVGGDDRMYYRITDKKNKSEIWMECGWGDD